MFKNTQFTDPLNGVSHHDDFHPLGHRIGFVVLFFSQNTGKVAQLPDRTSLATLPGQLCTQTRRSTQIFIVRCQELISTFNQDDNSQRYYKHSYLQDEGDARREEGHEDKVVGQDRHAAKAAHDL